MYDGKKNIKNKHYNKMIINRIFKKGYQEIKNLPDTLYIAQRKRDLRLSISERGDLKRIYIFCAPTHSNLGDQAQLLCWLRLFDLWYPDYEVIKVSTKFRRFETLREIRKSLRPDDLLYIHSGYLFFDPHPELPFILDIVRMFYDHPVTILPQTVNIMEPWMQNVIGRELDIHENLTLFCRDEVSLERARQLFHNVHLELKPDVVTSLIGDNRLAGKNANRKGVLFCLRNDLEKHYSDEDLNGLMSQFSHSRTKRRDTSIKADSRVWDKHREKMIQDIVEELATYEVVITDRYHGTIFSAIANTPVIVINSSDHKLSSGVKWFDTNVYGKAVQYAPTLEIASEMAKEILEQKMNVNNPPYFFERYWSDAITPPHTNGRR